MHARVRARSPPLGVFGSFCLDSFVVGFFLGENLFGQFCKELGVGFISLLGNYTIT